MQALALSLLACASLARLLACSAGFTLSMCKTSPGIVHEYNMKKVLNDMDYFSLLTSC